ncbi:MAG: TIGR03905 family TSCPD domain-containing protein [Clostridia bacterium]|nr:TIGR03905 family TSCPD domain-containing protein [Clostridia bacterium]
MKKHIEYKTHGTCSRMVIVDLEDGVVEKCEFVGGCAGNTQGVARLVTGMRAEEAIEKLSGIRCGFKYTTCPDQLAQTLKQAISEN